MKAADLFHLGIVTTDMVVTREQLGGLFGYEWGPEVGGPVDLTLPSGPVTLELKCVYSVTVPRVEVVREIPGTMWEAVPGIHHVGYWSDDVAADSADLEQQGFVREAARTGPDGSPFFTYHRSPQGLLIELVTRVAEPGMAQCWAAPAERGA
jgi:hypothetical protein